MAVTESGTEGVHLGGRRWLESLWVQLLIAAVLAAAIVCVARPHLWSSFEESEPQLALEEVLCSLVPAELGVDAWEPGEFAEYEWRDASKAAHLIGENPRRVRVEVVRRLEANDARAVKYGMPHDGMHWLRFRALQTFRAHPVDVFRLVAPGSLRMSDATPAFTLHDRYFPLLASTRPHRDPSTWRLVEVGSEVVTTPLGGIPCRRFELRSADGASGEGEDALAEVWTSSGAPPLAVVRARTANESMLLVARGRAQSEPLPDAIAPLVDGRSTLSEFCSSCHGTTCREILDPPR